MVNDILLALLLIILVALLWIGWRYITLRRQEGVYQLQIRLQKIDILLNFLMQTGG